MTEYSCHILQLLHMMRGATVTNNESDEDELGLLEEEWRQMQVRR